MIKFFKVFILALFSSMSVFSISCWQLAENNIPAVKFTSIMQFEFRAKLSPELLHFDNASGFSKNFIGVTVSQKTIEAAMSQAFESFGIKAREIANRQRKNFELKDIEKISQQEALMKDLLLQAVRQNQH